MPMHPNRRMTPPGAQSRSPRPLDLAAGEDRARAPTRRSLLARGASPLAAALLVLAACSQTPEPSTAPSPPVVEPPRVEGDAVVFAPDSPQLAAIRVAQPRADGDTTERINGRTGWNESLTARVNSPLAGRIVEIVAKPGDRVHRGDVLAVITSPDFGAAQAESRKAQAALALAERSARRAGELAAAGILPAKDLQAAEAELQAARIERTRTAARERAFGASRQIDQRLRIVSPIDGLVVDRRVNPGQEVRPEQSDQPLFVISDPTRLWVLLDVPEALTVEIRVGEPIKIRIPSLPHAVFGAQVEYVADALDPQTRTVRARASLGNPERLLKAEMFVVGEVEISASPLLRVPATALYLRDGKYYGFVESAPGRYRRREMQAEESSLGTMRVRNGLTAGERIVVDGALLLQQIMAQTVASTPGKGS